MRFWHMGRTNCIHERDLLENCYQFTEEATRMAILEGREQKWEVV